MISAENHANDGWCTHRARAPSRKLPLLQNFQTNQNATNLNDNHRSIEFGVSALPCPHTTTPPAVAVPVPTIPPSSPPRLGSDLLLAPSMSALWYVLGFDVLFVRWINGARVRRSECFVGPFGVFELLWRVVGLLAREGVMLDGLFFVFLDWKCLNVFCGL